MSRTHFSAQEKSVIQAKTDARTGKGEPYTSVVADDTLLAWELTP